MSIMNEQYIYDEGTARFKKEKVSKWRQVRRWVRLALATVTMSVIYYLLFALFFSTSTERQLRQENKALAEVIPELEKKEKLVSDVIQSLDARDDAIYEEVFKTSAPRLDPTAPLAFLSGLDTLPDRLIFKETSRKLNRLLTMTKSVDENFRDIAKLVDSAGFVAPPMTLPMKKVSFAQVGASVGMKMNPFYQVPVMHEGLDIIATPGENVYASASGVVSDVTRSRKGLGNVVTIKHKGGYATRYAHLGNIFVEQGMTVRRGQRIGDVGTVGNSSYAPHLHYVVRKDTLFMDPVHYFHVSVTPDVYTNMLIMSARTGQSMD